MSSTAARSGPMPPDGKKKRKIVVRRMKPAPMDEGSQEPKKDDIDIDASAATMPTKGKTKTRKLVVVRRTEREESQNDEEATVVPLAVAVGNKLARPRVRRTRDGIEVLERSILGSQDMFKSNLQAEDEDILQHETDEDDKSVDSDTDYQEDMDMNLPKSQFPEHLNETSAAGGSDEVNVNTERTGRRVRWEGPGEKRTSSKIDIGDSPSDAVQQHDRDTRALLQHEKRLKEWKAIEKRIAERFGREVDALVCNRADTYHDIMEERALVERTLPLVEATEPRFFTVASDFHKAADRVFETIRKPRSFRFGDPEEGKGKGKSGAGGGRSMAEKSAYLRYRQRQLSRAARDLFEHRPDFEELEVLGEGIDLEELKRSQSVSAGNIVDENEMNNIDIEIDALAIDGHKGDGRGQGVGEGKGRGKGKGNGKGLPEWDTQERVVGPNVCISSKRVVLEARVGETTSASTYLWNNGSVVLKYEWVKLPPTGTLPMPLTRGGKKSPFFFADTKGTLLPGEVLELQFRFGSAGHGVFSESWQLTTNPRLQPEADAFPPLSEKEGGTAIAGSTHIGPVEGGATARSHNTLFSIGPSAGSIVTGASTLTPSSIGQAQEMSKSNVPQHKITLRGVCIAPDTLANHRKRLNEMLEQNQLYHFSYEIVSGCIGDCVNIAESRLPQAQRTLADEAETASQLVDNAARANGEQSIFGLIMDKVPAASIEGIAKSVNVNVIGGGSDLLQLRNAVFSSSKPEITNKKLVDAVSLGSVPSTSVAGASLARKQTAYEVMRSLLCTMADKAASSAHVARESLNLPLKQFTLPSCFAFPHSASVMGDMDSLVDGDERDRDRDRERDRQMRKERGDKRKGKGERDPRKGKKGTISSAGSGNLPNVASLASSMGGGVSGAGGYTGSGTGTPDTSLEDPNQDPSLWSVERRAAETRYNHSLFDSVYSLLGDVVDQFDAVLSNVDPHPDGDSPPTQPYTSPSSSSFTSLVLPPRHDGPIFQGPDYAVGSSFLSEWDDLTLPETKPEKEKKTDRGDKDKDKERERGQKDKDDKQHSHSTTKDEKSTGKKGKKGRTHTSNIAAASPRRRAGSARRNE